MKTGKIILWLATTSVFLPSLAAQTASPKAGNLEEPGYWQTRKGNRMADVLGYLKEENPSTQVQEPLRTRQRAGLFIVYDEHRGEILRLERKDGYVLVDIHTLADPSYKGRLIVAADQVKSKNVALFFGNKVAYGGKTFYDQIRLYLDANQDAFPFAVICFQGTDRGVVYLDPLGSGQPQGRISFSSIPVRE